MAPRACQQRRDTSLTCAKRDESLCCQAALVLTVCGVMQDANAKESSATGTLGDTSVDASPDAKPKSHGVPVERTLSGAGKGASGTASGASAAAAAAGAEAVSRSGAEASKPVFKSKKRQVFCTHCKPPHKHPNCVLAAV